VPRPRPDRSRKDENDDVRNQTAVRRHGPGGVTGTTRRTGAACHADGRDVPRIRHDVVSRNSVCDDSVSVVRNVQSPMEPAAARRGTPESDPSRHVRIDCRRIRCRAYYTVRRVENSNYGTYARGLPSRRIGDGFIGFSLLLNLTVILANIIFIGFSSKTAGTGQARDPVHWSAGRAAPHLEGRGFDRALGGHPAESDVDRDRRVRLFWRVRNVESNRRPDTGMNTTAA